MASIAPTDQVDLDSAMELIQADSEVPAPSEAVTPFHYDDQSKEAPPEIGDRPRRITGNEDSEDDEDDEAIDIVEIPAVQSSGAAKNTRPPLLGQERKGTPKRSAMQASMRSLEASQKLVTAESHGELIRHHRNSYKVPRAGRGLINVQHLVRATGIPWFAIMLVCMAVATLAVPGGTSKSVDQHLQSISLLCIFAFLIMMSIAFDFLRSGLSRLVNDTFQPILQALYGELMGLGLLGIMLYFFVKFKVFHGMSRVLFCDAASDGKPQEHCYDMSHHELQPLVSACSNQSAIASSHRRQLLTPRAGRFLGAATKEAKAMDYCAVIAGTMASKASTKTAEVAKDVTKKVLRMLGAAPAASKESKGPSPHFYNGQCASEAGGHGRRLGGGAAEGCKMYHPGGCDEIILHLYEDLHITLFFVVILYFAYAIFLLVGIQRVSRGWYKLESQVRRPAGENDVLEMFMKTKAKHDKCRKSCNPLSRWIWQYRLNRAAGDLKYTLLRSRFMMSGYTGRDPLDEEFNFAEYLSLCAAEMGQEIVELGPWPWFRVFLFVVLVFCVMRLDANYWVRCWVAFSLLLIAGSHMVQRHLEWARDWLVPGVRPVKSGAAFASKLAKDNDSVATMTSTQLRQSVRRISNHQGVDDDVLKRQQEIIRQRASPTQEDQQHANGATDRQGSRRRSTIRSKAQLIVHTVVGSGHHVGPVAHGVTHDDEEFLQKVLQSIILYGLASLAVMCYHLWMYSSEHAGQVYVLQFYEIVLLTCGGIAPMLISMFYHPVRLYQDMVIAFNVEDLKKSKHITIALSTAKLQRKLQSLRLLVAARSELRFQVSLLKQHHQRDDPRVTKTMGMRSNTFEVPDEIPTGTVAKPKATRKSIMNTFTFGAISSKKYSAGGGGVSEEFDPSQKGKIDLQLKSDQRLVSDLRTVFDAFDDDKSGSVDRSELRSMLRQLGVKVGIDEFTVLLKEFGCVKSDDEITFQAFCETMMRYNEYDDEAELLHQVFRLFDHDESGGITVEEFEVTMKRLNAEMSREDIEMLVAHIKQNYHGELGDDDDFTISEDELKNVIDVRRLMVRSTEAYRAKSIMKRLVRRGSTSGSPHHGGGIATRDVGQH